MKIYMNGKLVDKAKAHVSVFDHGLLYGDGVFEGIRAYNGRVFMLDEHVDRLYKSAQAISLTIPMTKKEMAKAIVISCKANKVSNGYIRLIVTRGAGTLGLNPYSCGTPQVIIIAGGIQLYPAKVYENGLSVVTVGTVRNPTEATNPRIKSLNYLNNILAKIEAINAGVMECIMLNAQGYVAEASGDNIFIVRGDTLITPPSWCGSLEGVTRAVVMKLAPEHGYQVKEDVLARYDLYNADEMFLTGTAAEIISVVNMDRRIIGTGKPGPVTKELARHYHTFAQISGTPIT